MKANVQDDDIFILAESAQDLRFFLDQWLTPFRFDRTVPPNFKLRIKVWYESGLLQGIILSPEEAP